MMSCIKNVKKGDTIIFGMGQTRYRARSNYINEVPPGFHNFGPGYVLVRDIRALENTMLVATDMGRVIKIIKK